MASEVFVDASAYYAMLDPRDRWHANAKDMIVEIEGRGTRFITTDYVLDETVTLLQTRGLSYVVGPWLAEVLASARCQIVWMSPARFAQVRHFFVKHHDKEWSFTDCFSFCVMQERKMRQALSSDEHFRQAGFESLLMD